MVLPSSLPGGANAALKMQAAGMQPRRPPQGLPGVLGGVARAQGQPLPGTNFPSMTPSRPHWDGGPHGFPWKGGHGNPDPGFTPGAHGNPDSGFANSALTGLKGMLGGAVQSGPLHRVGEGVRPGAPSPWLAQQMAAMSPAQLQAFKSWTGAVGKHPVPVAPHTLPKPHVPVDPMAGMSPVQRAQFEAFTAAAAGAGNQAAAPSWQEFLNWNNQRDAANTSYLSGLAQNDFQRAQAEQQFGLEQYGLQHQNDMARSAIPYGDLHRGMLNSGVYGRHLQDQATGYGLALRSLLGSHDARLNGLSMDRQGLERKRASSLSAVDQSEAYRRMQLAQMLGGK